MAKKKQPPPPPQHEYLSNNFLAWAVVRDGILLNDDHGKPMIYMSKGRAEIELAGRDSGTRVQLVHVGVVWAAEKQMAAPATPWIP